MASKSNLSRFSLYVWLTMAMFVVVIVSFIVYVRAEKQIDRANELRQQSFLLSEELRNSSDDLTRMVREYVSTGNLRNKQHYLDILDIREGRKPRPDYWDLVESTDSRPTSSGPAVPLLTLMKRADLTEAELGKLAESKANSDALSQIELAAMALFESTSPPTRANRDRALGMLFDTPYQQAKADIMRPIAEFRRLLDPRTRQAVQDAEAHATMMRWVFILLAMVPMLLLWRVRRSLNAILGGSVNDVFISIARLGRGDLSTVIQVPNAKQDSVLGWLSETQANLARMDAERQRAESAVRESEKRFHHALDSMLEGCMLLGFDWTILYSNEAGARLARLPSDKVVGRKLTDLFPGIEQSEVFAIYRRTMDDRVAQRTEVSYSFPDGGTGWFELSVTPTQEGLLALGLDITRRHQAAQRREEASALLERQVAERTSELQEALDFARQASAAKSTFLSGMSHELRTPLNAILGFAQLLEMQDLPVKLMSMVSEIRRAGEHLLALIEDLLDLTRIESGKVPLTSVPVALADVVNEALSIVQDSLARRHIELVNHTPADACVLADPVRLKQVIVNLLSNAAKYNREHGRVWIDVEVSAAAQVRLSVRDTGPGVEPEKIPFLFRTFERLGAERTGIEGSGIGLAMARRLTELMGGTIGVASRVGEGSTFWIELPQTEGCVVCRVAASQGLGAALTSAPFEVLYIEDNAANLKVVEQMFELRPHWHLSTAVTGQDGLNRARSVLPNVVLLDIHLSGMDGFEVLQRLRADSHTQAIPVIALSADAMPEQVERGLSAGFHAYLAKPLDLPRLMSMLESLALRQSAP
ncbi:MAG: response regulator [Burkholderiales bacterium]|nr:response regulator [Burkholderiales bacterium]